MYKFNKSNKNQYKIFKKLYLVYFFYTEKFLLDNKYNFFFIYTFLYRKKNDV